MFERILIPLDGSLLSECVLPHAVAIAQAFDGQVHLLRVLEPSIDTPHPSSADLFDWQIRKAEAKAYLEKLSARFEGEGVHTVENILEGRAPLDIIEFSNENDMNLILLSSHGNSGISPWTLGSVAQKIIQRISCSLLIVPAYRPVSCELAGLRYRRILLPLDGSERAKCVIPAAANLAIFHKADIMAAYVVRKPEMPRHTPFCKEDRKLFDRMIERSQEEGHEYLTEVKTSLGQDTTIEVRLLISENVVASLQELVEKEKIDLVILSAHGYSGEYGRPYGSVATKCILYGSVPLLVIQDLKSANIKPA